MGSTLGSLGIEGPEILVVGFMSWEAWSQLGGTWETVIALGWVKKTHY